MFDIRVGKAEITRINYNIRNGYNTILCAGSFPDVVYEELREIKQATVVNVDAQDEYHEIEDTTPYRPNYGCYTAKETVVPIQNMKDDFICEESCVNVSLHSNAREKHLGTCIGYETASTRIDDSESFTKLNLFEDKSKDLHRMTLRAYTTEVLPFSGIRENKDGTYTLLYRDGIIWTTLSTLMNFTIDLSPSKKIMKQKFNFEVNIQQIFSFSHRKADLYLIPIYLLDLIVVNIDTTFPMKESGVCILAHRAGFENMLFDINLLEKNYVTIIKFTVCFIGTWMTFYIFSSIERERWTLEQMGRDFVNTVRNVLSISLYHPPKRQVFRIFLATSIWGFFVINFATQAAITSFFTAFKRGKDVETFDDIIEKGYNIEGMSSPDVMLPDTEERFNKINEKLVPVQDLFECVTRMTNDSRRWNESTLKNPLEASKTAWPVARIESSFLPEFPIITDLLQKDFEILNTIAKGALGEVYKVRKLSADKSYALKVLQKSQVIGENAVRQVKEEARIQEACGHHSFIVGAVSKWQTKKRLYIVSEYIAGGELLDLLDAYGKLPKELVQCFIAEIAIAIGKIKPSVRLTQLLKDKICKILTSRPDNLKYYDFGIISISAFMNSDRRFGHEKQGSVWCKLLGWSGVGRFVERGEDARYRRNERYQSLTIKTSAQAAK
ncbi:hypothetical protein EVAR_97216_1 [Eumeta japonica]|uniref:Protein kinase domain-containing protein n=1 Tax=Eumeta variegata TaxID=151549 RepID=A0A4C1WJA5_EUMVA|nr:hypothetical protein EVAR_97216_1 [Eumeta japonica]